MSDQEEKRRKRAEASRRWREKNHERYKQIARDAYHRRQAKKPPTPKRASKFATDEERLAARRKARLKWQKENPDRVRATAKRHYDRNVEAKRKKAREWYYANKDRALARLRVEQLRKRYGLTLEQYEALGTKCEICGRSEDQRTQKATKKPFRLAVDHCHDTGKVCGLLCGSCNAGIGLFQHDVAVLEKAISYLRKKR